MDDFMLLSGRPVRSLQTFLRQIALKQPQMALVIPDGIYGNQTAAAVSDFQRMCGMPATGEADNDTWNAVISAFAVLAEEQAEPTLGHIFPRGCIVRPGDSMPCIICVQHMLSELSGRFVNITQPRLTGMHDELSVRSVKDVQAVTPRSVCDGVIDSATWNAINNLYHSFVNIFTV